MQNNRPRNRSSPSDSSSKSDVKYARMKQVTKMAIKKFGPFLLTGLAAVAEHHWLKKDDDSGEEQTQGRSGGGGGGRRERAERMEEREGDEGLEVKELREEVQRMRDDLKRGSQLANAYGNAEGKGKSQTVPGSPRPPSLIRDPRALHHEGLHRENEEFVRMPFAPTPPLSFPAPFEHEHERFPEREKSVPRPPQLYDPPSSRTSSSSSSRNSLSRDRDRDRGFARSRSYSRRPPQHRHFSVPRRIPHHPRIAIKKEENVIHAGKVAAVAGLVEALHVDGKGEWIGKKGLRVGTTAAASFGATLGRDRERDRDRELGRRRDGMRMREVVVDVGTGVLVSRLVYGRVRDGEVDERVGRDGGRRRWSYCL
ncbi:hypothetical protein DL98DRAFT_521522 [Cadophora sp. DSE1049]|nr:hypothetical protein DL98DRAFT_521522 [Cadophora sp. DSE1049]